MTTNKVKWSDGLFRIFGYPIERGSETNEMFRARVHPDDIVALENTLRGGMFKDIGLNRDYRLIWPDGSIRHVHAEADKPVKDGSGKPVRWFGIVQDITERERAQEALHENHRFTTTLMGNLPGVVYRRRNVKDWTMEFISSGCLKLTGYKIEDLFNDRKISYGQLIHPDDRERVWDETQVALHTNKPYALTYRIITAGQEEKWVWDQGRSIIKNRMVLLEGFVTDITERIRTEELLRANDKFLNNVLDGIQDGISVLDKDLNIIRVNHVMEEWYPHMKPLSGKKCFYVYHGQESPCRICPSKRAIELKTAQSEIVPFHGADGKLMGWQEIFAFPLKDDDGNVIGVIEHVRDITERKRAEIEIDNAKAQAELYLDLMGHDINNMHQIALGYLEMARDMRPEAGDSEFLDKSIEVLNRGALLIQNVRKLQKLHEGVFQTRDIDIAKVLVDVQSEFGAVPHKAIMLNLNGCEHCHVRANELLHDVFANLVSNAIKHTGDRADIVIDLDLVNNNGNRYCRVIIEDNGPGIPDDFKGKIFNRMLKGTTNAKGIGLGLYLVKSLVESYNGKVWVEDRVHGDYKNGARFIVLLPAVE